MLKAILILPVNVLGIFPLIILYFTDFKIISINLSWQFLTMIFFFLVGFTLIIWTMKLFANTKSGSPAPWDPINKLIIKGPYAYVRNPMLSGVFMILFAETLLFQSLPLLYYLIVFILINIIYFIFIEEKELIKRYGKDYQIYKQNVPRFFPRFRPWKNDKE